MDDAIPISRTLLLVEITRRCFHADCNGATLIALTKDEAIEYRGFECARCGRWNEDKLTEHDIPECWREISS